MTDASHGVARRNRMRREVLCLGTILLSLLLSGCRHKQAPPTLPAILKTPDIQPPLPVAPSMESPPPQSLSSAPAVKVTETKPKRRPRKTASKAVVETAPVPADASMTAQPSEIARLGALSAGGEADPKNRQEATDLIASTGNRLEALLKAKGGKQEGQLLDQTREVRRFLQQAREALSSVDIEGSKTLATKAKLLMDDLEKWAQQ